MTSARHSVWWEMGWLDRLIFHLWNLMSALFPGSPTSGSPAGSLLPGLSSWVLSPPWEWERAPQTHTESIRPLPPLDVHHCNRWCQTAPSWTSSSQKCLRREHRMGITGKSKCWLRNFVSYYRMRVSAWLGTSCIVLERSRFFGTNYRDLMLSQCFFGRFFLYFALCYTKHRQPTLALQKWSHTS